MNPDQQLNDFTKALDEAEERILSKEYPSRSFFFTDTDDEFHAELNEDESLEDLMAASYRPPLEIQTTFGNRQN